MIQIAVDRQGWSSVEVDGKTLREATVPRLLEELARRHVAGAVRFPCGRGVPGSYAQYGSASDALRGLAAQADRDGEQLAHWHACGEEKSAAGGAE
jgi:hypothetical protein